MNKQVKEAKAVAHEIIEMGRQRIIDPCIFISALAHAMRVLCKNYCDLSADRHKARRNVSEFVADTFKDFNDDITAN